MLTKKLYIGASVCFGLLGVNCIPIMGDDDEGLIFKLAPQDSVAVRHILNENGLDSLNVHAVTSGSLVYSSSSSPSFLNEINLSSQSIKKFVFSKYLDSLHHGINLNLMHNCIDTLIFPDFISIDLGMSLDWNNLTAIPDDINKLYGNIFLSVGYNQIQVVSPNIMKCTVTNVFFNGNKLCSIPDSIAHWITKESYAYDSIWQTTQICNYHMQ